MSPAGRWLEVPFDEGLVAREAVEHPPQRPGDDADPRVWEASDALGDVYATIGRYDDALAQHGAILAAPRLLPDVACRAHRKRGSVLEKQAHYDAALDALEQAKAIVRSGATGISPLAVPLISADIALVRKRRGEYDLAIAACE